ncbi:sigma factor-like helix-turn-helix DNA-binding protein [Halomonas campisalis]|nr:sigma factor-like helix-turn-helix DNA-binding protein [Halomonas campisalis]MDR5862792.1 sigma factor-like helix-turn-helix DNA-binding protein [Halomonas campisalis]
MADEPLSIRGDEHKEVSSKEVRIARLAAVCPRLISFSRLHLSDNLARVFSLRELMGLSTQDVSREVGIRENHCAVLLHRARLKLRACIESRWLPEALPC